MFVCGSCDSYEPDGGANAAILVPHDRLARRLAEPPTGIEGNTAVIGARALTYTREPRRDDDDEDIHDKVAGTPEWLQRNETPTCQTCHQPMRLAAQFSDSLDEQLNFGNGAGYVFVCAQEHGARFLTQS